MKIPARGDARAAAVVDTELLGACRRRELSTALVVKEEGLRRGMGAGGALSGVEGPRLTGGGGGGGGVAMAVQRSSGSKDSGSGEKGL
jgi:hypothetical protein